jgi:hypothetical protein
LGLDLSEQVFQDEQGNSVISTGTELQLKEFVSIALFPDLDSQTQPISITSSMLFKVLFQTPNPVHVLSRRALGNVEPGNAEEAQIADVTGGLVEWRCGTAG